MMRWLPLFAGPLVLVPCFAQNKDKPKDQPPQPLYALTLAADPGKTTKLTLRGLRLDTVTEIRLGEPKSTGKVLGKARKVGMPSQQMNVEAVGDSEVEVEVTLPAEVPGGRIMLTAIGPGGESKAMPLLVNDDLPRTAEKEPNDGFKEAMPIAVPALVEGTIRQNQDVDVYRMTAKAGEKFRIEVQATRAGSPVAPMLTVFDSAGRIVCTGETTAESSDPIARFEAKQAGDFLLSIIDAHDQGGPMFAYRLVVRRAE